MTDSTEIATPPKFTKSRNSTSSVQIQIHISLFDSVSRDSEKSEFLDLADFESFAISVETVIEAFGYSDPSFLTALPDVQFLGIEIHRASIACALAQLEVFFYFLFVSNLFW